ncbi:MAG: hypothetical protein QGI45_07550, partial [Myxococcota bacterium]|nr:hypothetical protein [Myxococcota bacterium]
MPDIKPKTLQRFFLFVLFASGIAGLLFGGVPSSCGGDEFSLEEAALSQQDDGLGGLGNGNAAVALLDPYAARFKLLSQYKSKGPCQESAEAVHAPSAAAQRLIESGREKAKAKAGRRGPDTEYSIPVVFHNVWEEECDLDDDENCFLGGTASLCPDGDCETQADEAIAILNAQFDAGHIYFHRAFIDPAMESEY